MAAGRRTQRLSERTERRARTGEPLEAGEGSTDGASPARDEENPYWAFEDPRPHPNPAFGCVRRGLCCMTNPGWFAPGEVEQAAELKGMTPDEFVRTYLVIDWAEVEADEDGPEGAEGDREVVHVFAPAKVGRDGEPVIPPGTRTDSLYQALPGRCIFYDGWGCAIYGARPYECRHYDCTNHPDDNPSHDAIARMWRDAARAEEEGRGSTE